MASLFVFLQTATDDPLVKLGVGGIFAVLVLKAAFDGVKKILEAVQRRRGDSTPPPVSTSNVEQKEDTQKMQLHDLHQHQVPAIVRALDEIARTQRALADVSARQESTSELLSKTQGELLQCHRDTSEMLRTFMVRQEARDEVQDTMLERIDRKLSSPAMKPLR